MRLNFPFRFNLNSFILIILIDGLLGCKMKPNIETEKVRLGKLLFYEKALSFNNSKSCSSCHNPSQAFSDGYRTSATATGENTKHNAPSLINVSKLKVFAWKDSSVLSLEKQMLRPLYAHNPIELGTNINKQAIEILLKKSEKYKSLTNTVFQQNKTSQQIIVESITAYLKTLKSTNAPYDNYVAGTKSAISQSAQRGEKLFYSNKLNCGQCHSGTYFTRASSTFNCFEKSILNVTKSTNASTERIKIPSLRNVWLTKPYFHNGSIETLSEVIDLYAKGENIILKHNKKLVKPGIYKGFTITKQEKQDVIQFLISLTDSLVTTKFI